MRLYLQTSIAFLVIFTVLTGVTYPLAVTFLAQTLCPHQASGSLILTNGRAVGSDLIGQPFDGPRYFWGRPSATSAMPYDASASTGFNLGPSNPVLREAVKARVDALRRSDTGNRLPVPVDLVTASASGLDPDISIAAAEFQIPRVARLRGLSEARVHQLVREHIRGRQLGILGEPRVNVLELNLSLDALR